jgi:hypothetical protein
VRRPSPSAGLSVFARPVSPQALALGEAWTSLADLGVAALLLWLAMDAWAPSQDLPWKPLSLAAPPGLATPLQLARAAADPMLCRKALTTGDVAFVDAPSRVKGFCSTENTLRLQAGATRLSPAGPLLACPEALAYALWVRHTVQPAARAELGASVAAVEHYGSYACRNVYGRAAGRPSEHARAKALDVSGFRLADGRRITVAADTRRSDARGRFVAEVRQGACRWFHGVLGPGYNAAHRDHLHLDVGPYRICA